MSDDDGVIGDVDPLDDEAQDLLLDREGRVGQLPAEPRTEGRDCFRQGLRPLRCGDLAGHDLLTLPELLPRLAEPLSALLQLVQLDGPDLVGVDQALLLPLERRALAPESLQFPLGVGELRPVTLVLAVYSIRPHSLALMQPACSASAMDGVNGQDRGESGCWCRARAAVRRGAARSLPALSALP